MKKKKTGLVLMIVFTILTLADCLLTWVATPELEMEGNPLVRVFGLGWPALIITNILTLAIFYWFVDFAFNKYRTPTVVGNDENDLKKKLAQTSGKGSTIAMLGFSMSFALIFSRLIVVLEWVTHVLKLNDQWIQTVKKTIPFHRPDLIIAISLTLILSIFWIVREEKAKKELSRIEQSEEPEPLLTDFEGTVN